MLHLTKSRRFGLRKDVRLQTELLAQTGDKRRYTNKGETFTEVYSLLYSGAICLTPSP